MGYTTTDDEIYEYLVETDDRVSTASDIAEGLGVTDVTVRNKIDSVLEREGIKTRQAGRAAVYWYEEPTPDDPEHDLDTDQERVPYRAAMSVAAVVTTITGLFVGVTFAMIFVVGVSATVFLTFLLAATVGVYTGRQVAVHLLTDDAEQTDVQVSEGPGVDPQ